jgi:diguanylate cyclase (GGDEF)-like protein
MSKNINSPVVFTAKLLLLGNKPLACIVDEVSSAGIRIHIDSVADLPKADSPFALLPDAAASLLIEEKNVKPWQVAALFRQWKNNVIELSYPGSPPPESNRLARLLSETRSGRIDTAGTLNELELCAENRARLIYEDFLAQIDEVLFLHAKNATSSQVQIEYLGLRTRFRNTKQESTKNYVNYIRAQVRNLESSSNTGKMASISGLSLVENEKLEGLLDDRDLIQTIYEAEAAQIEKIKMRFAELVKVELQEEIIPVSPQYLCSAFRKSLAELQLPIVMLRQLHVVYQGVLLSNVKALYEEFNQILKEAGVLPDLEISNRQAIMMRQKRNQVAYLATAQGSKNEAKKAAINQAPVDDLKADSSHDSPEHLYQTVRNLMGINKKSEHAKRSAFAMNSPNSDELIEIINSIENSTEYHEDENVNGGIKKAIKRHLAEVSDDSKPLSISHDDCIDLYESMFNAIVNGNEVEPAFKEKILKLKTPFLKRVLVDEAFFSSRDNPARILLNQFSFVGGFAHTLHTKIISRIDEIIDEIIQSSPFDVEMLISKSIEIREIIDRQEELRKRHISRVINAHEGGEKLALANYEVDRAIKLYSGENGKLPQIICELFNLGLRQFLLLTRLNHGSSSNQWRSAVEELRTMLGWLQSASDKQVFYQRLDGFENTQILEVINHLNDNIDSVNPGLNEHKKHIALLAITLLDRQFNPAILEQSDLSLIKDYTSAVDDISTTTDKDARLLKHLELNDWINKPEDPPRHALQIVWISRNQTQYVLADRVGHEHSVLRANQLADMLREGWQINKDHTRAGAVDRGIYATLQNVYHQLTYQRCHDELTGLINRKEFERGLEHVLDQKADDGADYCMLTMDIDQFTLINNLCGHNAGDKLLKEIAEIFSRELKDARLIARIGGNEFAALIQNQSEEQSLNTAEAIRQKISCHPFLVAGHPYQVTASFGITHFDIKSTSVASIFRRATGACSMAKELGRDRIMHYREDDSTVRRRQTLEEWYPKINEAMQNNNLYLKVQRIEPNTRLPGEMPHYEVLLGLNDQDNKPIPIWQFIQAAEYYKKMQDVDRWVINATFDWISNNPEKMKSMDIISINLSGTTMGDEKFLDFMIEKLDALSIDMKRICFEITETSAIQSLEKAIMFITEIKNLGCLFSLDDFGTGFASYDYLKRLPVDYLKIDGVFIKNLTTNPDDMAVVKSICEIGHYMNKKIVAEFVETREIWDMLKTVGVDYVQGYGIEMPKMINQL